MRHNTIPANRCDVATLVEVGLTWLELDWLLEVLRDVLDEDLGATTSQQVFLIGVELEGLNGDTLMDLGS